MYFKRASLDFYCLWYWSSQFLIPKISLQSCARILLGEDLRIEYLKKMRNPKLEALRKTELMKEIVKKCNNLTSSNKAVKCSRCGYVNGLASRLLLLMLLSSSRWKIRLLFAMLIVICGLSINSKFVICMLVLLLFVKIFNDAMELRIDAVVSVLMSVIVESFNMMLCCGDYNVM